MSEIVYTYTRQQAIDDGMFVDVSETAKEAGIKIPVAVTSNLWHTHIVPNDEERQNGQDEQGRLWDVLTMFVHAARRTKDNFVEFEVLFSGIKIKIWGVIEAQSPTDPSPAINLLLPEDY